MGEFVRTSRFLHSRIAALAVVVIFRQRIQKSDKRIDVALTERHVLKLRRRISEQSLPCQLRHVDVEVDDVTEGQPAAVVEVGLGVGKITKSRRLEFSPIRLQLRLAGTAKIRKVARSVDARSRIVKFAIGEQRVLGVNGVADNTVASLGVVENLKTVDGSGRERLFVSSVLILVEWRIAAEQGAFKAR